MSATNLAILCALGLQDELKGATAATIRLRAGLRPTITVLRELSVAAGHAAQSMQRFRLVADTMAAAGDALAKDLQPPLDLDRLCADAMARVRDGIENNAEQHQRAISRDFAALRYIAYPHSLRGVIQHGTMDAAAITRPRQHAGSAA